jgi:AcrR family transcriptional regulator
MVGAKRRRVTKSAEDRRRDLLDAAVHAFTQKGVGGATVADITRQAGVAKGTFYLYFDSKDHVVGALRERFVSELTEHATPFVEAMGRVDWWDLADAVARDMVDWTLAHREICTVLMQAYTPETYQILSQTDLSMIRLLAVGIRAGAQAGAFQVDDPELAAAFLYNGIIFTVIQQIMYVPSIDRDRLIKAARAMWRRLLAPTAPVERTRRRVERAPARPS